MFHSIAQHSLPSFLHAFARNDPLLCSTACCVMLQHNSLCHGQVCHAAVMFFCSMARNDVLQHLMTSLFVPQQETMCCCRLHIMLRHGASYHGVVHCAVAWSINLFGFGFSGLGGMEVLGFCVFLLQHCTFLRSILWCYFCASALFYVPWHCALCCGAVFCAAGLFLCCGAVFVKRHWLCSAAI